MLLDKLEARMKTIAELRAMQAELVAALEEIGREQGAINATVAADRFQEIARAALRRSRGDATWL